MTDRKRFEKFAPEPRPQLPEGYSAPLDCRTTREMIGERLRAKQAGELGPQVRDVKDVPSLHDVVLDHFKSRSQRDGHGSGDQYPDHGLQAPKMRFEDTSDLFAVVRKNFLGE